MKGRIEVDEGEDKTRLLSGPYMENEVTIAPQKLTFF
jgi:hypothetical protein